MNTLFETFIEQLSSIKSPQEFDLQVTTIKEALNNANVSSKIIANIDTQSYYMKNNFSVKSTTENMQTAKDALIKYFKILQYDTKQVASDLSQESKLLILKQILNNFYMFLEEFTERPLNSRAGIKPEHVAAIKIKNEYDVQHILYALLKPLFPDARLEVTNDTGFSTVRCDIWLKNISVVIEVKCSRDSMTIKNLTEEIASDMVHYTANHIFFFIYDKNKIIKNPQAFKDAYEKNVNDKTTYIILHQPKIL